MIDEPSLPLTSNMDVDLSPFPKYDGTINSFNLVKDHMSKFSSERWLGRITSSYRADNGREKSFIAADSGIKTQRFLLAQLYYFTISSFPFGSYWLSYQKKRRGT